MFVCICKSVSTHDIRRQAADGVRSFAELQARTGCSTCCGCCEPEARRVLNEAIQDVRLSIPLVSAA